MKSACTIILETKFKSIRVILFIMVIMKFKRTASICIPFGYVQSILLSIIYLIVSVSVSLTVAVICPLQFLWRTIAILIARFPIFNHGRLLTPFDMVTYDCNGGVTLVTTVELREILNLVSARELFFKVANTRLKEKERYPELRMYPKAFLGFAVMTKDMSFSIERHVVDVGLSNSQVDITKIHQILLSRTFVKFQSPWEVVLFQKDGGTVVGFRIHHSIADALSILKLLVECIGGKALVKAQPSLNCMGVREKFKKFAFFPIVLGSECVKFWTDIIYWGIWRNRVFEVDRTESIGKMIGITQTVNMAYLKRVARTFNVATSAVILEGLMGGLGRFFREVESIDTIELPLGYVLPSEYHPDGLVNHWCVELIIKCSKLLKIALIVNELF